METAKYHKSKKKKRKKRKKKKLSSLKQPVSVLNMFCSVHLRKVLGLKVHFFPSACRCRRRLGLSRLHDQGQRITARLRSGTTAWARHVALSVAVYQDGVRTETCRDLRYITRTCARYLRQKQDQCLLSCCAVGQASPARKPTSSVLENKRRQRAHWAPKQYRQHTHCEPVLSSSVSRGKVWVRFEREVSVSLPWPPSLMSWPNFTE